MKSTLLTFLLGFLNGIITGLLVTPLTAIWWIWIIPSTMFIAWYFRIKPKQNPNSTDYIELTYPAKWIGDITICYDINGEYATETYTNYIEAIQVYIQLKKDYPQASSRIIQGA